jgi:hypothetical protein
VADALSRKSSHDMVCDALSSASPSWIQEVVSGYDKDEYSLALIAKLCIDPNAVAHFTYTNGLLRYEGRVWIGANPELHKKLLLSCHSTALGGHSGKPVTHMRMKKLFAWKGMKTDIT